jgi:hypothetical protein
MLAGPLRSSSVLGIAVRIDDVLGLTKHKVGIEIGVVVVAAIASPETGVHIEVHQVGEPTDICGPARLTAGQIGKLIEVDRVSSDRLQVGVDEGKSGSFRRRCCRGYTAACRHRESAGQPCREGCRR